MLPEFGGEGGARFVNGTGKYLTQGGTGTTMGASADDFSDDFTPTSFLHLWVEDIPVSQWLYLRVMAANVVGYGPPQTLSLNGTEPTSVRMNGHFYMERFDPKNPPASPPIHPPTHAQQSIHHTANRLEFSTCKAFSTVRNSNLTDACIPLL